MSKRLDALRGEFTLARAGLDQIENAATDANRELTDQEKADTEALTARCESLAPEIAAIVRREESLDATAQTMARVAKLTPQVAEAATEMHRAVAEQRRPEVTPGEYLAIVGRALVEKDPETIDTLKRAVGVSDPDASTGDILARFAQPTTASEAAGVVPSLIVGDLVQFVYNLRPTVQAMRNLPMPPKGKDFKRPRLTVRTSVAAQATEFTDLSSTAYTIVDDTVTKVTLGGAIDVSEQDIDWTEPAYLDLVVNDLAEVYGVATESHAVTAVVNAITTNFTNVSLTASAAVFQTGLGAAAAALFGTAKTLPDVLFASVDRWGYLVSLTDSTGRPLFPNLGPMNAQGQLAPTSFDGNPMGLKLVVSPDFPTGFMALGVSRLLEHYEQNKGQASIALPGNLSVRFAYRGYIADNVYAKGVWAIVSDSSTSYHTSTHPVLS